MLPDVQSHTRRYHAKEIFVTWWALMYGLCSADVLIAHYAPVTLKAKWDAAWLAPKWGWRTTLIGFGLLTIGLIFEKSFRMVRKARNDASDRVLAQKQEHEELERRLDNKVGDLELQLDRALATKPIISYTFEYDNQQVILSVTNRGTIAEVWASLRIQGSVSGRTRDIFALWSHTNDSRVSIAKGQTCRLILASLRRNSRMGVLMADWEIPYASHIGYEATHSTHTSIIGREDAQAPDIHLYVGIFSNPDCEQVIGERHIVLHASSAEELSN